MSAPPASLRMTRLFFVAVALLLPSVSLAQPVLLWGVSRGCDLDKDLTHAVKEMLDSVAFPATEIQNAMQGISSTEAAAQIRANCRTAQGRVMGGFVEPGDGKLQRYRLWLHDLSTGQTAYSDGWCNGCKLTDHLSRQAAGLADKPRFSGAVASNVPSYCQPEPSATPMVARSKTVVVALYGDGKPKAGLLAALKRQLYTAGRDLSAWQEELKTDHSSLVRMLQGDKQGQIIGVESTAKGANLWIYDALTDQTFDAKVECPTCSKEDFADKVAFRAVALLDESVQPPQKPRPPEEVCAAPLLVPQCSAIGSGSSTGIEPKLATTIKGLTWGLVAATGAASVALGIANPLVSQSLEGRPFNNTLTAPFWTMASVTIGAAIVAIPVTIALRQAQQRSTANATTASAASPIQCPN